MVVLPVESQKTLVQILHFLPAFPAELLACLSQVCNTGRVSASLATMLLRTVHLRYEGYDTSPFTNAILKLPVFRSGTSEIGFPRGTWV